MRILILFIVVVIFAYSSGAQCLIRGKIIDSSSQEILPYAHVVLLNEDIATVSNSDGYFEINPSNTRADLMISYLGYETKVLKLDTDKTITDEIIFFLTPKTFILNEVVVAPGRIERLMKEIFDNFKNKINQLHLADAFYRDFVTVDNFPVNSSEMFYKVRINQSGIGDWNFVQGRTAIAKEVIERPSIDFLFTSIVNNSFFLRNFPVTEFTPVKLKQNLEKVCIFPICEDPTKNYVYEKAGEKIIDDKKVVVITFSPRISNSKFRFYGKLEVIEDDLQLIYLDLSLNHPLFYSKLVDYPLKGDRDQYVDSCYFRQTWYYNKYEKDWRLERIGNSMKYQVRSKTDKAYRKINNFYSQIYFYNYETPEKFKLGNQIIKENDRKLIRGNKYDPDFWENNSKTITEIPFEQSIKESFVRNGFYGNLFPGGILSRHYPQCSDLENETIQLLDDNYYKIFELFVTYYFYYTPEKEIHSLFNSEIRSIYDAYKKSVINHKNSESELIKLNVIARKILDTPEISDILNLWMKMNPVAVKDILIRLKQYEKKYNRQ